MGGAFHWPGVKEVMEYRKIVKQLISDLIISAPLILPITMEHPWVIVYVMHVHMVNGSAHHLNHYYLMQWSLFMGMEHERYR